MLKHLRYSVLDYTHGIYPPILFSKLPYTYYKYLASILVLGTRITLITLFLRQYHTYFNLLLWLGLPFTYKIDII